MTTTAITAVILLTALVVIGAFMFFGQEVPATIDPSEWKPLNNGYPGWSNKVQPW